MFLRKGEVSRICTFLGLDEMMLTAAKAVLLGNLVFMMAGKVTIQDGHNEAFGI